MKMFEEESRERGQRVNNKHEGSRYNPRSGGLSITHSEFQSVSMDDRARFHSYRGRGAAGDQGLEPRRIR